MSCISPPDSKLIKVYGNKQVVLAWFLSKSLKSLKLDSLKIRLLINNPLNFGFYM